MHLFGDKGLACADFFEKLGQHLLPSYLSFDPTRCASDGAGEERGENLNKQRPCTNQERAVNLSVHISSNL